ncbi:hypothetical protein BOX15_Mlig002507g1, partial [Macrostomum lignano]
LRPAALQTERQKPLAELPEPERTFAPRQPCHSRSPMGQQLSSESYCLATIEKLVGELNTTDSQVSESHVTCGACGGSPGGGEFSGDHGGGDGGGEACRIAFAWREWARVSKFLERVLPNSEQKRLLRHVLLEQTGLSHCSFADANEGADESDELCVNGSAGGGADGPRPSAESRWSVHLNYGDDSDKNAILYRDFVKLHFQLDHVTAPLSATQQQQQQQPQTTSAELASRDSGLSSLSSSSSSSAGQQGVDLADRLAEDLRRRCQRIGVALVVTKAAYHSRDCCCVVSGTVDVRSVLRNSGSLELRSRVNVDVEDAELGDQLQRSLSGLRDRLAGQQQQQLQFLQQVREQQEQQEQQQQQQAYFPMVLYLCGDSNRVILIYGRRLRHPAG